MGVGAWLWRGRELAPTNQVHHRIECPIFTGRSNGVGLRGGATRTCAGAGGRQWEVGLQTPAPRPCAQPTHGTTQTQPPCKTHRQHNNRQQHSSHDTPEQAHMGATTAGAAPSAFSKLVHLTPPSSPRWEEGRGQRTGRKNRTGARSRTVTRTRVVRVHDQFSETPIHKPFGTAIPAVQANYAQGEGARRQSRQEKQPQLLRKQQPSQHAATYDEGRGHGQQQEQRGRRVHPVHASPKAPQPVVLCEVLPRQPRTRTRTRTRA